MGQSILLVRKRTFGWRMYRHWLTAPVTLSKGDHLTEGLRQRWARRRSEWAFKANDPLYLLPARRMNTTTGEPCFSSDGGNQSAKRDVLQRTVRPLGQMSISFHWLPKPQLREPLDGIDAGKLDWATCETQPRRSIVRADRELDLETKFLTKDPRTGGGGPQSLFRRFSMPFLV